MVSNFNFNQKGSCYLQFNEEKYSIYGTHPYNLLIETPIKGIKDCKLLNNSNILFIKKEKDEISDIFYMWDDNKKEKIKEINCGKIIDFQIKDNIILLVTENNIKVFNFKFQLIKDFEIQNNNIKTCKMNMNEDNLVLALPNKNDGHILIENITEDKNLDIYCHYNDIQSYALNYDGNILATTSTKGTLLRLWDTKNGYKIYEFRINYNYGNIHHLVFNNDNTSIALIQDYDEDNDQLLIFDLSIINLKSVSNLIPLNKWYNIKELINKNTKISFDDNYTGDELKLYLLNNEKKLFDYDINLKNNTIICNSNSSNINLKEKINESDNDSENGYI